MDSFAHAAAYLQPSVEFVAKLSSIIPVWLMMVMADKHFLGLPLLEGSVWYSPRIPPRFSIGSSRHSGNFGPSQLERGFPGSTTPYQRPFQALRFFSNSRLQGAASTTALTLYQPLEVHDPFISSSAWLEHGYVGSAVLLVVIISFLAMITNGRCWAFRKSRTPPARNMSNTQTPLSAHGQLTEEMESPICWESILEDLLSNHSDESLEDCLDQPGSATKTSEDEHVSPLKMIADTAEKADPELALKDEKADDARELLEENKKSDQTETVTETEKEHEDPEEEFPEMHDEENEHGETTEPNEVVATAPGEKPANYAESGNEDRIEAGKEDLKEKSKVATKTDRPCEPGKNFGNHDLDGQKEKTQKNEVVSTTSGGKPASCVEAGKEKGSEAGKRAGKEYAKEGSKADIKEGAPTESGKNVENEDLEILAMEDGIKKKKKRVRQNAKKRAAKLAAAEEPKREAGDSSNAFLKNPKQREDKKGKSKEVEPEVVKAEAGDALASPKSQKQDEVTTKEIGGSSNAFLEDQPRTEKDGKPEKVEPEVVKSKANDALATAKGQQKIEAAAKVVPTTGKGGGYSLKEADLCDATFIAADMAKTTSLPLRPPTPQSNDKSVPVNLPSKPQLTGLPTPKSSGTPQPSPAATENSSPGAELLSSLITRPKGYVAPLLPHHQSFGAAQSSSSGLSGQFSTPFKNIPGLNIPKTIQAPNHIPFKPGAANPSPNSPRPLFGSLNAQGGPKAGTDPRPKNAYRSGNGYANAPIFGNLPPGPSSNDAFKLPPFGPSAGSKQSGPGPAKTTTSNQSIFQNITPSCGPFTGFGSPSKL